MDFLSCDTKIIEPPPQGYPCVLFYHCLVPLGRHFCFIWYTLDDPFLLSLFLLLSVFLNMSFSFGFNWFYDGFCDALSHLSGPNGAESWHTDVVDK